MRGGAFSGGGANGAVQLGMMHELALAGVRWDVVTGSSIGSINAGFVAQYAVGEELRAVENLIDLWLEFKTSDVHRRWFPFGKMHALWKQAVRDAKASVRLIQRYIDPSLIKSSGRRIRVGGVSMTDGREMVWTERDDSIVEGIVASTRYPFAFAPYSVGSVPYTDWGVRTVTPLGAAIKAGCDEVDVLITMPDGVEQWTAGRVARANAFELGMRYVEILVDQVQKDDLRTCEMVNQGVGAGCAFARGKRRVKVNEIRPPKAVGDPLEWSRGTVDERMVIGRRLARAFIERDGLQRRG